jgi:hypothetical protein
LLLFRASPSTQLVGLDLLETAAQSPAQRLAQNMLLKDSQQRAHQRGLFPKASQDLSMWLLVAVAQAAQPSQTHRLAAAAVAK